MKLLNHQVSAEIVLRGKRRNSTFAPNLGVIQILNLQVTRILEVRGGILVEVVRKMVR